MDIKYDFKKELKLREDKLYAEADKKSGWPGWPIPDTIKDMLKARALKRCGNYDSEDNLDGDPDEQNAYIDFLSEVIGEHQESVLASSQTRGVIMQTVKTKRTAQEWSDWRRKLFNRRFNIVEFVAENRKLDSKQIKWQWMATEWNKAHPLETLNHAQMARIYNRGLKEDGIMLQIRAMSSLEAIKKLANSQDLKDWHDGKPHIRIIKTPHFTIKDSTTGKKGGKSK